MIAGPRPFFSRTVLQDPLLRSYYLEVDCQKQNIKDPIFEIKISCGLCLQCTVVCFTWKRLWIVLLVLQLVSYGENSFVSLGRMVRYRRNSPGGESGRNAKVGLCEDIVRVLQG